MTEYVVGFMFNTEKTHVGLIRKNRPRWQAGKLNGIGGKVENNEMPEIAMIREFREETGVYHDKWEQFLKITVVAEEHPDPFEDSYDSVIWFYRTCGDLSKLKNMTDESIEIHSVACFPGDTLPNLRWIVPFALDECKYKAHIIELDYHRYKT